MSTGRGDDLASWQRSEYTFEAFIYAWISLNGWASCCCDRDRDRDLINILRSDPKVSAAFDSLVRSDSQVARAVVEFRDLWPIFRTSQVRAGQEAAAFEHRLGGRQALIAYYTRQFPRAERAPDCHLGHHPGQIQADWAHTLEALYRVRNNLFHGTKSSNADVDREIVDAAAAVLVPVVEHMLSEPFR